MTMQEMRSDFATYLESLLDVHDSDYTVDTTERRELELNVDRKSRIAVMGDPAKYAYITDLGQAVVGQDTAFDASGDINCYIGQRFRVQIYHEKNYTTSQAAFEAMIYNDRDDASPGVLDSMRAGRSRTVSDEEYFIGVPQQDAFISVTRGIWDFGALGGQPELYHYLEFEVYLIS